MSSWFDITGQVHKTVELDIRNSKLIERLCHSTEDSDIYFDFDFTQK